MTTKRAFLRGAAAVAAAAIPAVAIAAAPEADTELVALAAEIERLCAIGRKIYAKRVDPFEETFQRLMTDGPGPSRMAVAFAYSDEIGREAAIEERNELDVEIDRLWERMTTIPAATHPGRAAKVRALLAHVQPEWHGPKDDLDWAIGQTRALLGEFAGMSEEELA